MSEPASVDLRAQLDAVYRTESGRILATLIRLLGDFERAEDAMQDAFDAALRRWPKEGVPANPRAWLISAGRFKAIDALRRRTRFQAARQDIADALHGVRSDTGALDDELPDDRLRLIFTCCHPGISPDAGAALTLREVCGLTTEEIARAFLTSAPTIAQRIVRAKARIRDARSRSGASPPCLAAATGGSWVFAMIGPDGKVYRNESVFDVIERDRKIVIRHVSPPTFVLTIALERTATGTRVDWEQAFDDPEVAKTVRPIVEPANEQNLDRLTAELKR
jgi:RNA polymerase sigma factor (sigma-70 family)